MDPYSNVIDHNGTAGARETETYSSSPFAGGVRPLGPADGDARGAEYEWDGSARWMSSPFSEGLVEADQSEAEEAFSALAAELDDEEFDEAVQALVDEAAGRQLASAGVWSAEATSHLAAGEVEAWMANLAAEADGLLEHLELHFGARTPESLAEGEIDTVLGEALAAQGRSGLDGEDFLGALARKARSLASGAARLAKRGIAAAGRRLLGPLFRILRQMVPPLLRKVLAVARGKLPPHLRRHADDLAAKLGVAVPSASPAAPTSAPAAPNAAPASLVPATASEPAAPPDPAAEPSAAGAALAERFDAGLAQVVTENDALAGHLLAEWESAPGEEANDGPLEWLDSARADLVDQLVDAVPGSDLTSEVEQFIPAVMAALPLVRTGIGMLGRDKVVALVAKPVAELIKGLVGPEVTQAFSLAIADQGLRLLRLEAEAHAAGSGQLGAEALAATVEDTLRAVGSLPPESQSEPLRLRAEVHQAFAEAAARHLPRKMLRPDLDTHEIEGESAVWVSMPRGPGRRYRYRKCSRIFPARVSRHVARAIVLEDGGTLEQRFLDEGATGWPVEAEVHVYESLPGTHLGHLAASEGEGFGPGAPMASDFEELTAHTASLLLNQPGLGRRPVTGGAWGRRFYRVVLPRRPPSTTGRHKRAVLRLVLTGARPVLRVHLRLSEREAHRVGELLAQRAEVRLAVAFRSLILGLAQRSLPGRLVRQAQRTPGVTLSAAQATALAAVIGERMVTAISAHLRSLGPTLAAAASDPAPGLTLTFQFSFADRAALTAGRPDAPTVTVRPGRHRD